MRSILQSRLYRPCHCPLWTRLCIYMGVESKPISWYGDSLHWISEYTWVADDLFLVWILDRRDMVQISTLPISQSNTLVPEQNFNFWPFVSFLLAKETGNTSPSCSCKSTTPTPVSEASVLKMNCLLMSGKCKIGALDNLPLSVWNDKS